MMRLIAVALALAFASCQKKPKKSIPPITFWSTVPSTADIVVAVHRSALERTWLARVAARGLASEAPHVLAKLSSLEQRCGYKWSSQLINIALVFDQQGGEGQKGASLLIVHGDIAETQLVACLSVLVPSGLTDQNKIASHRTWKVERDGRDALYLVRVPSVGLLLSNDKSMVELAAAGPAASQEGDMGRYLNLVRGANLWAIGRVPSRVANGLVLRAGGKIEKGVQGFYARVDLGAPLKARLGLQMASNTDAKSLKELLSAEKDKLFLAAQLFKLGEVVSGSKIEDKSKMVEIRLSVSERQLDQVIEVVDKPLQDYHTPASK